jgi:membrane associated rhomboid family serine protease
VIEIKFPYATLLLLSLTFLTYMLVSGWQPYIYPINKIDSYSLNLDNIFFGSFTYLFMHVGFKHLVGNMALFLVVGTIAEQRLKFRDVFILYILCGALAGFFYALINPNVWVVGASAAVSAMVIAAFIADIKKSVVAFLAIMLLIPYAIYPATDSFVESQIQSKESEISEKLEKIQTYEVKQSELDKTLEVLQYKLEQGIINETQYMEQRQNITQQLQNLNASLSTTKHELNVTNFSKVTLKQGKATEEATPVSFIIHIFGFILSAIYIFIFRKDILKGMREDIYGSFER